MRTLYFGKRHFILLIFPALLLFSTYYAYHTNQKLSGKVIVVDAGHGGIDPGANRPGILEKDINLAIALALREQLHQHGAKVVLSRQEDIELSPECDNEKVKGRYHRDLAARLEMVEESDADVFISIHANAVSNAKRHGAEVFFSAKSQEGKILADFIQTELCKVTQTNQTAKSADYFVLRRNKVPSILIEVGYITNKNERQLLQTPEYQQIIAEAITKGIFQFF